MNPEKFQAGKERLINHFYLIQTHFIRDNIFLIFTKKKKN